MLIELLIEESGKSHAFCAVKISAPDITDQSATYAACDFQ